MKIDNLKYKAIHHTDVYRTSTPQLWGVNRYHKKKFNMKSKMGWWVGYNGFFDVDGSFTQTRLIGEETAAVKGHNCDIYENCDAISFCFAMNGFKQVLNTKQRQGFRDFESGKIKLKTIDGSYTTIPKLNLERKFHRELQANRTCAGTLMTHEYLDSVLLPHTQKEDIINGEKIKELQSELDKLRKLYKNLLDLLVKVILEKYGK